MTDVSTTAANRGRREGWRVARDRLALVTMAATALIYLLAVAHRPMLTTPESSYDDGLYLKLALHLVSGHWLGPYDGLTLAKGPGFPVFLALNYLIGLPAGLALCLVYVASSAYACWVVRRVVPSRLFGVVLFAALLFAPPLASSITTYIERDFFYAALVLALAAGFIDLALGHAASATRPGTVVLFGILAGWAWLTREEGVWLLPPFVCLLVLAGVRLRGSDRIAAVSRCLAALVVASLVVAAFGLANRVVYGRFEINGQKSGGFAAALNALEVAAYPDWRAYVPVPAAARQRIYVQSPTFRRLQPILDPPGKLNRWADEGCGALPQTCGDIAGGWFLWAFRAAADEVGVQGSPEAAEAFYRTIAAEVTAACRDGRLACARWLPPLVPPFTREQALGFPSTLLRAIAAAAMLQPVESGWRTSPPPSGLEAHDVEMIGAPAFGPGRVVALTAEYEAGRTIGLGLKPWGSAQIIETKTSAETAGEGGRDSSPETLRRFSALVSCLDETCGVTLSDAGGAAADVDLAGSGQTRQDEVMLGETKVSLDQDASAGYTLRTRLANRLNRMLPGLQKLYAALTVLGGVALLFGLAGALKRRRLSPAFCLALVLGVGVVSRAGLIALVDATAFPAINDWYLAPAFPLVIAMSALALWSAASDVFNAIRRRRAAARGAGA